ncbi:MAG: long-chain-fatty-acid--CoA ligase FadD1 [Pseudohongiellaceae bacterium]|jgi:long-chain acyl-CoA synthetase
MIESLAAELRPENFPSLNDVIDHIAREHANFPAYTCLGKTLSYGEINALAERFAAWLRQQPNLQQGDRIAIQLPNVLQFPIALYGAIKAGLVVVNTNPLYTPPEMHHQFVDSQVKAIVILDSMCSKLEAIIASTSIETVVVAHLGDMHPAPKRQLLGFVARYIKRMVPPYQLPNAVSFLDTLQTLPEEHPARPAFRDDDVALLLYTGGTTGVAKGAMISHRNLVSNMMQLRARCLLIMNDQAEIIGAPLPLYHSYAFLLHCLAMPFAGIHNVLVPDPRNIKSLVKLFRQYHFSGFVGINTLYLALLRHPGFANVDLSNLKFSGAGGMAMSTSVSKEWQEVTGCEVIEGYGLTECSPVVAVNLPGKVKHGTVGPLVPETEARLVDENGQDVESGERGELWVRGPQVMLGYWQNAKANREILTDDGWLKTGDYAEIDDENYIRIVDRKKDMILVSGFNVFPNEVEDWVNQHPGVLESGAVGFKSERTGEAIRLFVVRRDMKLTEKDVVQHSKAGLTAYKVPKEVVFVNELPKSNVGKILRKELRP